jgi:SRSO17 transposase
MSLLDHPDAQALLKDAIRTPEAVRGCRDRLRRFLGHYLPHFYRKEQRDHAALVVRGLLSDLQRKTAEPIADRAGVEHKNIQFFIGSGRWDDDAILGELWRHVRRVLGESEAVLVLDPSAFPKKGTESCGVARQRCGRLGKVENCQVGVFLAYSTRRGAVLVDRQLYLPREWAEDPLRRAKAHVPSTVVFQEKWQIASDLRKRSGSRLPHRWIVGDDELGRSAEFRANLRAGGQWYVLDVPCNTLIRDLERRRPPRRRAGVGRKREVSFVRADAWAARQSASRWVRLVPRQGEKGPLEVEAMSVRVKAKHERRVGPEERLVVVRTIEAHPRIDYALSNAPLEVGLSQLVEVRAHRSWIETALESSKGEAGLAHYEVRSWVGWHHHMTLALLASWFLELERTRGGGENPGGDGPADPADLQSLAREASGEVGSDRGGRDTCSAA